MPKKPHPELPPRDLPKQLATFAQVYLPALTHHADYLGAVEANAEHRREKAAPGERTAPAGMYQHQADNMHRLGGILRDAAKGKPLPIATPDERIDLQSLFNQVVGSLNMIIEEHAAINGQAARRSSAKRLEQGYRKKHFVPDDEPLEESIQRRIRRTSKRYKEQAAVLSEEIISLIDMRDELNAIRANVFKGGTQIGGAGGGVHLN